MEQELRTTKEGLQDTIEDLEASNQDLRAANEEILSMNEELQSTNEELETAKEETQSMNEELATVNSQLQEKVKELAKANNEMDNLLEGANIATLFLDPQLQIQRFTPTVKTLFNLIEADVGRPISDFSSAFLGADLQEDARTVLDTLTLVEREICTPENRWYLRRILPYRDSENRIHGVGITFIDMTQRQQAEAKLREAKAAAEQANRQKSQFLTAASHDLRQPLQTLDLLHAALVKQTQDPTSLKLLEQQADTLRSMEDLLNTLLDVSRLEAGTVTPSLRSSPPVSYWITSMPNSPPRHNKKAWRCGSCPAQ